MWNICKFIDNKKTNDKIHRNFDESAKDDNPFYVPLEVTSLNSISNDFEKYKKHFNYENDNENEENKNQIKIIKNEEKEEEKKQDKINKLNVKQKVIVHEKFKKYPKEVRIDMEKKIKIFTTGPINVSEYRENRIFKDETIEEHQIYYYKNKNSTNKVENPYLIVK